MGVPNNFEVTVPASTGDYLAWPTWDDYDPGSELFQISVNNTSGALLNNSAFDGFTWPYTFDPSCRDYSITSENFFVIDGFSAAWSGFGPTCDVNPPPLPPPPAPSGRVPSGTQTCVAGDADFEMAARRFFHADGTKATVWLVPVSTEVVSFPERAWLRKLEVIDWGTATNLHLADSFVVPLEVDGWDLDGTVITPAASGPTIRNFAVGEMPMGIMMGTSEIGTNPTELPRLHLEWSCQMNGTNPHAIAVADHSGHVGSLPEMSPIRSRIVFWVASDFESVRIAPEGRYLDYFESGLVASGSGGKTFSVKIPTYGAIFTGRLVPFGGSYKLFDGQVTHPAGTVTVGTKTLTAL